MVCNVTYALIQWFCNFYIKPFCLCGIYSRKWELCWHNQYRGLYCGLESMDWFKTVGKRSFFLLEIRTNYRPYPTFYSMDIRFFTLGWSAWGVKLTTHLHLVLGLIMSGAAPLILQCAFVVCTGTAFPFI